MLWSRQLWKIEGLPHSCFGVFRYRNGPTDLFPIAWPCCYRIQVHRTNGHFSRSGSLIPRERLLLAKIISRRPIPRSVARNGQHCVFNWDPACRSPLVTFIANRVFDSCHAVPQSDVTRRLSVIPCLLTPAKFVAWRNIHIRIKHTELWLASSTPALSRSGETHCSTSAFERILWLVALSWLFCIVVTVNTIFCTLALVCQICHSDLMQPFDHWSPKALLIGIRYK
jgi:hypothetical protein